MPDPDLTADQASDDGDRQGSGPLDHATAEKDALERLEAVFKKYRRVPAYTDYALAALVLDALCWPRSDGTVSADQASDDGDRYGTDSAETQAGAWVIYDWDNTPYAISLHDSAEAASRQAARQGYGKVAFWPFGAEFDSTVKEWERSQ